MTCANCGRENPDDALFCAHCGAPLVEAAVVGPGGAEGHHGALRRPRGLHEPERAARPRGCARHAHALLRAAPGRARAPRRDGREVHRRRGDGGLRRSDGARGRPRARRPGGARDPRRDGGDERAGSRDRPPRPGRREHGGGARLARRPSPRRRGDGRGRRGEHGRPAPDLRSRRRDPRRRGHVPRHGASDRVPIGRSRAGEGEDRPDRGLGGDRGAIPLRHRHHPSRRHRARGARAGARAAPGRPRSGPTSGRAAARDAGRRARHREEPLGARALRPHRGDAGPDHLATGPVPALRRRGELLGARRDGQGRGGHPRDGHRRRGRGQARPERRPS